MRSSSTQQLSDQEVADQAADAVRSNGHSARPVSSGENAASAEGLHIVPARVGDHVLIFQLLQHIFHAPSAAEFQAAQDAPLYEPSDRLIARAGQRMLGHVHTVNNLMQFDSVQIPFAEIRDLGVLPEFRGQGVGTRLLQAVEERIVGEGGQLAVLRTGEPKFFASRGWVVCGRHCYSTATARNTLAQLADVETEEQSPLAPSQPAIKICLWRQVEQDNIAGLHQVNAEQGRGCVIRNHAYWRWLVSRHGYDRIYVAVEEHSSSGPGDRGRKIVGYAALRGARILELFAAADHPLAARQLLARACSDAIERGEPTVRLDAPPFDPLHRVMQRAGGRFVLSEMEHGNVLMAKLFDPIHLLQQMRGDIFARARKAGLSLPLELGLLVEGEKFQLSLTRRSAKIVEGKLGRSYLTCGRGEFSRLLLGDFDVAKAEAAENIGASTRVAIEVARALLPYRPLWFPPLDHLPAE